jgi:hypothetical protein
MSSVRRRGTTGSTPSNLQGPFPLAPRSRSPAVYGPEHAALLRTCWELADHICSRRLAPFLRELLSRLHAYGELRDVSPEVVDRVAQMSAATVDRLLRRDRGLTAVVR